MKLSEETSSSWLGRGSMAVMGGTLSVGTSSSQRTSRDRLLMSFISWVG